MWPSRWRRRRQIRSRRWPSRWRAWLSRWRGWLSRWRGWLSRWRGWLSRWRAWLSRRPRTVHLRRASARQSGLRRRARPALHDPPASRPVTSRPRRARRHRRDLDSADRVHERRPGARGTPAIGRHAAGDPGVARRARDRDGAGFHRGGSGSQCRLRLTCRRGARHPGSRRAQHHFARRGRQPARLRRRSRRQRRVHARRRGLDDGCRCPRARRRSRAGCRSRAARRFAASRAGAFCGDVGRRWCRRLGAAAGSVGLLAVAALSARRAPERLGLPCAASAADPLHLPDRAPRLRT